MERGQEEVGGGGWGWWGGGGGGGGGAAAPPPPRQSMIELCDRSPLGAAANEPRLLEMPLDERYALLIGRTL